MSAYDLVEIAVQAMPGWLALAMMLWARRHIHKHKRALDRQLRLAEKVLYMMEIDDYVAEDDDGVVHHVTIDDLDFVLRCTHRLPAGQVHRTKSRQVTCVMCLGA